MDSLDSWFQREVFRWRTGASVTWSLLSIPLFTVVFVFLSCVTPFTPLQILPDFLMKTFSLSFVLLVLLVMVVNTAFFIYSSTTFTVIPDVALSRFASLKTLVKPNSLIYGAVCCVFGSVLTWGTSGVVGGRYADLTYRCAKESEYFCLNEHHLFLVLYGGYTGLMYMVLHMAKQHNYLQFPTLQQAKFFQVRCKTLPVLLSTLWYLLWQIKFFYLLFYLFGHIPREWIMYNLSLQLSSDYVLDSLWGLLDLSLFWQALLSAFFIQFLWSFAAMLFKIYNSEHYEFPISSMFDNFKNKCLVDALACHHQPLVQYLGFYDLCHLAKHSPARRREVFSLSQPGGHPHNWKRIIDVCLSVINEFSDKVKDANWKILSIAPVRQPSGEPKTTPKPTVMTVGNGNSVYSVAQDPKHPHQPGDTQSKQMTKPPGLSWKDKFMNGLKKKPILGYFLGERPETRSRQLFAGSQVQIWAVEALSSLCSASFTEDSYGVVQMSLSEIITAVLTLQENTEKHFKLCGSGMSRRGQRDIAGASDHSLRYQLQMTLKSSMYKIVDTFGKHILDLRLPMETERKLKLFMEYKE